MSKWIDIDDISLLKTVSVGGLSAKALWKRIRQQPSIDLITCAECRHCTLGIVVQRRADGYEKTVNLCRHPKHTEEWSVPKDWYCADAERRENE